MVLVGYSMSKKDPISPAPNINNHKRNYLTKHLEKGIVSGPKMVDFYSNVMVGGVVSILP